MSMGKREDKQQPLWVGASELPRSAGHRFYEKLNELLREAAPLMARRLPTATHVD